jgi:F420-dependent oxidoreductase-like protein
MRIGINGSALLARPDLDAIVEHAGQAVADGFPSYWLAQTGAIDALTALVLAGRDQPGLELGTAVIPTYPRHPSALATQATTAALALGGRLALGIGLSHRPVIEDSLGLSFEKPVRHMREYLSILVPLLRDGKVAFKGETLSTQAEVALPDGPPPQVLVAALGPQMLRLTGRMADGTVLWMVGPKTIREHIRPVISDAAEGAGRTAPRIVCGLPIGVTDDADGLRQLARGAFAIYGQLPSYRAMLDREGAEDPSEVALIGNEAQVRERLEEIGAAGATDFVAVEFGRSDDERERTRALLRSCL